MNGRRGFQKDLFCCGLKKVFGAFPVFSPKKKISEEKWWTKGFFQSTAFILCCCEGERRGEKEHDEGRGQAQVSHHRGPWLSHAFRQLSRSPLLLEPRRDLPWLGKPPGRVIVP